MYTRVLFYVWLFSGWLSLATAYADRITSAWERIQKGEFDKAKELLDKQLNREPDNAGAAHVYALYFFANKNPYYQLDSAYFFVRRAIALYPKTTPKDTLDWAKKGISPSTARQLKAEIETKAFANAREGNTLEDINRFIANYSEAAQVLEAIAIRHELAWAEALRTGKLEDYEYFIKTYPDAVQLPQAIEKRDRLLLQRETQAGTLSAVQSFIQRYPDNRWLSEAILKYYLLLTWDNSLATYKQFVKKYPHADEASTRAWEWLGARIVAQEGIAQFLQQYPKAPQKQAWASLSELESSLYAPFVADTETFGFIDQEGKIHIPATLETLTPAMRCMPLIETVFVFQKNAHLGLMDKQGKILLEAQFDKIEPIAAGLWRVSKNGIQGAYLSSGREILPVQFDAIEVLNEHFLKIRKNRRWGIASYNGVIGFEARYAELESKQGFIIGRNNAEYAFIHSQKLIQHFQERNVDFKTGYDRLEVLAPRYIKASMGGKLGVYADDFTEILPPQFEAIDYLGKETGFVAYQSGKPQLYRPNGQAQDISPIEQVRANAYLIGIKQQDKWGLLDAQGTLLQAAEYDSLALLAHTALLIKNKPRKVWLITTQSPTLVEMTAFKNFRAERAELPNAQPVWVYENAARLKGATFMNGKQLPANYSNIYPLDASYLSLQQNGKYGLADTTARVVIPPKYDGISNTTDGKKLLLLNKKYGLYDPTRNLLVEPSFESLPIMWGDTTTSLQWYGQRGGLFGVIDAKGKVIIPFDYQAIIAWKLTDSLALAQDKKGIWTFISYKKQKPKGEKTSTTDISFDEVKPLPLAPLLQETLVLVRKQHKWGLWGSVRGEIVSPEWDSFVQRKHPQGLFYLWAEQKIANNNRILLAYFNFKGTKFWERQVSEDELIQLECE